MSSRNIIMNQIRPVYIYNKPPSVCQSLNEWEKSILLLDKPDFVKAYQEKIQAEINCYGLRLRLANLSDIEPVHDFIITRFSEEFVDDISRFDLFRFIQYGHGLILEDENNKVCGCIFEIGYEKIWKISYLLRLGVDESLKGKGIGKRLIAYSSMLAMQNGSQQKNCLISYNNLISLYVHVNQAGWLIDKFYMNLNSLGLSFELCFPLTPEAFLKNRVDLDSVKIYFDEKIKGVDYLLIDCDDIDAIKEVYEDCIFRIAAIIPEDIIDEKPYFFALPVKILYYE